MSQDSQSSRPSLGREQLLEIYYYMRLTRTLEERLVALFRQSKVIGGLYRSLGQEGEAVASAYALDFGRGDLIAPLIRNMGAMLVAGATPLEIVRQYMGKGTGPSRGRDLNIHFADLERGFIGPISPLGDMIPVMSGALLARRMERRDSVALAYIGDGGSSTGAFYEGVNFAAVQKLPLIVVVENNGYAYSTPTSRQTGARRLSDKAHAFGCFGETVDGNDVQAVYWATRRAVERARSGEGVTILEVVTFRMKGHAEHDNQSYVTAQELEHWRQRDPLDRLIALLEEHDLGSEIAPIDQRVRREVDEATDAADASPMPEPEEAQFGTFAGDRFWETAPTGENR
ncbi:MAG: thiamine pyrophosphate-dependent dehydrogenase E1 component subunit alpha [Acidobacteria bacterium]|nr:thiamine pyrophosphate-dependent dehydrogenase E1 component subunit alpha [Acidobacteriota bacterium]